MRDKGGAGVRLGAKQLTGRGYELRDKGENAG